MSTNEGVVDPIHIPESVRRLWAATPVLARVFVGLALLDAVARTVGLLEPAADISVARPLSFIASFLPRDLLILLPAVIVVRLPTASRRTPWVLRGAIVVAFAELLGRAVGSIVSPELGGPAADVILPIPGWLAIGWGLGLLDPKVPPLPVAGAANLVALTVVLASLAGAVLPVVLGPAIDPLDSVATTVVVFGVLGVLRSLALAYLFREVVRGFGDPRRAPRATAAGTIAALLYALLGVGLATVAIVARIDPEILRSSAESPIWAPLFWLGDGGAFSLLVVAFGLGLADPDRRVGGMALD